MQPLFDEVKRLNLAQTIVEQVKQLILRGQLHAGQKLPSERELADQLRVGRSSVREATSAMLALGIIEIRPGEGAFIREDFPRSMLESIAWSSLMINGHSTDLLEARMAIEVATAELAALRSTPEERRRLHELVEQMPATTSAEAMVALDLEFHLLLAQASQNIVLREIVVGLQHLMRASMLQVLKSAEIKRLAIEQHRSLCEAIDRQAATEAAQIMRAHLTKDLTILGNLAPGPMASSLPTAPTAASSETSPRAESD